MTIGQAIKAKCIQCLQANTAGSAYDCASACCPLYCVHPFRGRSMPVTRGPEAGERESEVRRIAKLHVATPGQRPTRAHIRAMCHECQVECADDCTQTDCPLHEWTPLQPGGTPGKAWSDATRDAARRRALETNSIANIQVRT